MLMTISRKGKRRILHSCAICFREAVTFLPMAGYSIRSARCIWSFIPTKKDPDAERAMEDVLDASGIFYDKTETWIDSEKLYEVLYSFDMEGM